MLFPVFSCRDNAYFVRQFGNALVADHVRAWGMILEATFAGSPFDYYLHALVTLG